MTKKKVGNGSNIKFWFDQWIQGKTMVEIAPNLLAVIPQIIINKRTVQGTLDIWCWVGDIKGPLSVTVLVESLLMGNFRKHSPSTGCSGSAYLEATSSGNYSSKSAYNEFFFGTIRFTSWKGIWQSWPLKVQDFHLV